MGADDTFCLSNALIHSLNDQQTYSLANVAAFVPQEWRRIGWKSPLALGLEGKKAIERQVFMDILCLNYICLSDEVPDELVWSKNPTLGSFTTKLGYSHLMDSQFNGNKL